MCHFLVVEVQTDVARMLLAIVEWSFNSSSTTWRISGTSYLVFKLEGDRQPIGNLLVDSFLSSIHKKLEGSRGVVHFSKKL